MADLVLRRHERFWFADGSLQLSVEDTLYRIHRYLFETHATKFFDSSSGSAETGHAISHQGLRFLDDVKKVDFDRLLSFLYPRDLAVEEKRTPEEWMSVLKLASKWGFASLQTKAIGKVVDFVSPIEKIVLGREYNVPGLLLPGYVALCQSNVPLSQDEGRRLGLEAMVNICNMRQELCGKWGMPFPMEDVVAKVKSYLDSPALTTPPPPQSKIVVGSPVGSPLRTPPQLCGAIHSPNESDWDDLKVTDAPKTAVKGPMPQSPRNLPEEVPNPSVLKSPFGRPKRLSSQTTSFGFGFDAIPAGGQDGDKQNGKGWGSLVPGQTWGTKSTADSRIATAEGIWVPPVMGEGKKNPAAASKTDIMETASAEGDEWGSPMKGKKKVGKKASLSEPQNAKGSGEPSGGTLGTPAADDDDWGMPMKIKKKKVALVAQAT